MAALHVSHAIPFTDIDQWDAVFHIWSFPARTLRKLSKLERLSLLQTPHTFQSYTSWKKNPLKTSSVSLGVDAVGSSPWRCFCCFEKEIKICLFFFYDHFFNPKCQFSLIWSPTILNSYKLITSVIQNPLWKKKSCINKIKPLIESWILSTAPDLTFSVFSCSASPPNLKNKLLAHEILINNTWSKTKDWKTRLSRWQSHFKMLRFQRKFSSFHAFQHLRNYFSHCDNI